MMAGETLGKRIAVVTGGTGALGTAVAQRFAESGYETHVTSSREADARAWTGPGLAHAVDLADLDAVRRLAASFSDIHAIALCAGGFAMAKLADFTEADLDRMMTSNFKTASFALGAFGGRMRAGASAVVVGSQSYEGAAGSAFYSASKAAVVSLVKSAALEWKKEQVRVNAVLPDTIDTPANRRAMPGADFTRWASPQEIADVIVWLCSPEARAVTGNAIKVGR